MSVRIRMEDVWMPSNQRVTLLPGGARSCKARRSRVPKVSIWRSGSRRSWEATKAKASSSSLLRDSSAFICSNSSARRRMMSTIMSRRPFAAAISCGSQGRDRPRTSSVQISKDRRGVRSIKPGLDLGWAWRDHRPSSRFGRSPGRNQTIMLCGAPPSGTARTPAASDRVAAAGYWAARWSDRKDLLPLAATASATDRASHLQRGPCPRW